MSIEQVGMPMKAVRDVLRNSAALLEEIAKIFELFRKTMAALPAQPDVEITAFAKAPTVSLQILAKIKFGRLPLYPARIALRRTQLEFDFLGCNDRLVCPELRTHKLGYRAEMSTCSDDQRC